VRAGLSADEARTLAEKGLSRASLLERALEEQDKLELHAEKSVLFRLNSSELTPQGKAILDELASQMASLDRYVVELEGYTDRTGDRALNLSLSQRRAEAVARYLTVKHNVPLRRVSAGRGQETSSGHNSTPRPGAEPPCGGTHLRPGSNASPTIRENRTPRWRRHRQLARSLWPVVRRGAPG
jgi:OOP family OmpA-OmpF porin